MKNACCIYRIDDVTPGMDWNKFYRAMKLFQKYHVVPLIGVVPDNRDPSLTVGSEEARFWEILRKLRTEGSVEISQHGYQHRYITNSLQPYLRLCGFKPQSEFCGLSYRLQYSRIKAGKEIFENNGIPVDIFMAPGHTFDRNTVKALQKLEFKAVTDGIGLFPAKRKGIVFVPQQEWEPVQPRCGIRTICLHLNHAGEDLFKKLEAHLSSDSDILPFSAALHCKPRPYHALANFIYKGAFWYIHAKNGVRELLRSSFAGV